MARLSMTETDLFEFRRCSLRTAGGAKYEPDPYLSCANELWRWVSMRSFRNESVSVDVLRTQADVIARKQKQSVWLSPSLVRMARRIADLADSWHLMQPVLPYSLGFARGVVTGEYAVVSKPRSGDLYAVCLRENPLAHLLRPDLVAMLRVWHMSLQGTSGSLNVLHYSFLDDFQMMQKYESRETGRELTALMDAAGAKPGSGYAVPGDYCDSCSTLACEGVMKHG